jgi:two-component system response regulator VicR
MSKTILVIDDDDLICSLVTHSLAKEDYNVITAADGQEGVEQFEAERPDLVVVDIAMPGMSGLEVAQMMRAIEQRNQYPHTPIIILTAFARSFFLSTGGKGDVDSYLMKPIAPDQLLAHVHQFLNDT